MKIYGVLLGMAIVCVPSYAMELLKEIYREEVAAIINDNKKDEAYFRSLPSAIRKAILYSYHQKRAEQWVEIARYRIGTLTPRGS